MFEQFKACPPENILETALSSVLAPRLCLIDGSANQCWKISGSSWKNVLSFPGFVSSRHSHADVCPVDGGFVLVGADSSENATVVCSKFTASTEKWSHLPPLPFKAHKPTCVSVDGVIYIFGGKNNTGRKRLVFGKSQDNMCHLDVAANEWKKDPKAPVSFGCTTVTSVSSSIYVIPSNQVKRLYKFSTINRKWSRKSDYI